MTKRFTFGAVSPNVAMIKDNGQGLDIGEIVDLLNSLSEENEQLRQKLDFYLLDEFEWKEKYGD